MTLREFLETRRRAEYPAFERVLKALPVEHWNYRPHEKSASAGEIVWMLARETQACSELIDNGVVNWLPEPMPADPEAALSAFREQYAALDDRIGRVDETPLAEKGTAAGGRTALLGSVPGRVPLVFFLRRDPSPRSTEYLYSSNGGKSPFDLWTIGR
jgi:hypothetical protein